MPEETEKRYVKIPEEPERSGPDFDKLLEELKTLERAPFLTPDDIERLMVESTRKIAAGLAAKDRAAGIKKTDPEIKAALQEPFRSLLNHIMTQARAVYGSAGGIEVLARAEKLVHIVSREAFGEMGSADKVIAEYQQDTGRIVVPEDFVQYSEPSQIVFGLAALGYDPDWAEILHHEYIHAQQGPDPKTFRRRRAKERMEKLRNDWEFARLKKEAARQADNPEALRRILDDMRKVVHAERAQKDHGQTAVVARELQAYRGSEHGWRGATSGFIAHLREKPYSLGDIPSYTDKCMVADLAIRRLYALGLSDAAIANLADRTAWDEQRRVFEPLEETIARLAAEKGLEEEELDDLVLADDLRRKIAMLGIKRIAQEELVRLAKELGVAVPEKNRAA